MPYLGNSPVAGDHVNNFKVLDDISSHTATFDGSSTDVVDTTNNTIRIPEHRFIQGQRVTYTNGGGGNIGGLTTGTAYFVIFDTASTFKLATSASNAANSTVINLSSVGTGSSHTLNAAFDGVNTKFKITYQGGDPARFNNATQLNIAINNVIQRPNISATTFTEGFAIEDHHKIVFKVAPTSEDIFWGSIIANTLTTFDISDHKIDTFTGDGSTTEFTLSHTPANNESLMVTINGVLQHPSNASTARAYTLIASIIQFTAAPGVGDEIQVRHLGFAGATTADVSGFYGRTGNVALTSDDHITTGDITSRNINSSGIITATSFDGTFSSSVGGSNANFTGIVTAGTFKGGNIDAVDGAFSGNVTIGGTLTYEDVSNIDSVGIITARKDIHVGAGLSVVGVSTLTGRIFAGGTVIPGYSGADDLTIGAESGNHGITIRTGTTNTGGLFFSDATSAGDNATQWAAGVEYHHGNGELRFYEGGNVRAMFKSGHFQPWSDSQYSLGTSSKRWSNLHVDGATIAGNATITGDLDVDGHTNLDNVSIAGITTFTNSAGVGDFKPIQLEKSGTTGATRIQFLESGTNKGGITYSHDNNRIEIQAESSGKIRFNDVSNAQFALLDGTGLTVNGASGITALAADINGDLDVDGHTNLDNVSVAGVTTFAENVIAQKKLSFADSPYIGSTIPPNSLRFGNNDDLILYHTGNYSGIDERGGGTGGLVLHCTNNFTVKGNASNKNRIIAKEGGAVELYHNNSKKFQTTSGGATVTGALVAAQLGVGDNEAIYAGGSSDIQLYHDASGSVYGTANSSYIKVQGVHDNILDIFTASATGKIRLKSNNLAETMLVANGNGAVDLYFDNNLRFQTANYGVNIFGQSAAVSFGLYTTGGTKRGGLYATNGNVISLLDGQDHNILRGVKDGTAELYYDNVKRLETTSTGANVTGNFGASGNITLSGSFIMPDSLLHANDTTTRIRFPGPGTFAVDTSGNEVLRIASDANVRIIDGDLRVDTTGKGIIFGIEGGSNRPSIKGNYSSSSDNNMVFNTTGEERLRITGAGNG